MTEENGRRRASKCTGDEQSKKTEGSTGRECDGSEREEVKGTGKLESVTGDEFNVGK